MRTAFALLIGLHGAIHLIGFAKAFGFGGASTPAAITRPLGLLWLLAAVSYVAAAAMLYAWPDRWWVAAALALVASQAAIASDWSDAKWGTIVNAVALVPIAVALVDLRGSSLSSTYRREVERALARSGTASSELVTEAELEKLPAPLRNYVRRSGAVGRPHVRNIRVRWHGQMRNGIDAPWMAARIEQIETFDEPTRLFYMEASRYGVPFQGLHEYIGDSATMRVRVASLFEVVNARGSEMNRSETVTLFNDMCLLAPATLLDANATWRVLDDHKVRGTFTNAGNTISAELSFDAQGDLVLFVSNDRDQSADGKTYRNLPWSTPVTAYRDFGAARVAAKGEAVWHEPSGPFVYGRFEIESLEANVAR